MKVTTIALIVLVGNINALLVLVGVALGGFLVYRTKREPHEALFRSPEKPGSAVAKDEHEATSPLLWGPDEDAEESEDDDDELSWGADVMSRNKAFLNLQSQHPHLLGDPQQERSSSAEDEHQGEG